MSGTRLRWNLLKLEERAVPATFRVDYTYDTNNFFNTPERRAAIERVAADLGPRLADTLTAIQPSGNDRWTASFFNPITNTTVSISNPTIATNEIVLFVGGGAIGSSELAIASGGAWSASGRQQWLDTVSGRGQAGAIDRAGQARTDIAPWGGFLAFDSSINWDFASAPPSANQYDFDSVANHEILHILGFGLGDDAFERFVVNDQFTGPITTGIFGGPVPLEKVQHGHWQPTVRVNGVTPIMVPSIPIGTARPIHPLDYAVLDDIGWEVADTSVPLPPPPPPPPPPPLPPPPPPDPSSSNVRFVVGSGQGATSTVVTVNAQGQPIRTLSPFGALTGGVRVASADFNGDGVKDIVSGTGPGAVTQLRVLSGTDQSVLFDTQPFESGFRGGIYVSAGDVTGDNAPDVIVTPDEGGGPRVDIYDGKTFARIESFFGIDDPNFRGGARSAVGDLNGDNRADLVVAAGFGGGPRVAGFDGTTLGTANRRKVFGDFFAFEQGLRNGSFVTVGDVDGDGVGELVVGGGPGGAPRVLALSGASLRLNQYVTVANFFAGDTSSRGGVRLAVSDVNADGRSDLITGAGDNAGSRVTVYDGKSLSNPTTLLDGEFFPSFSGGVFVG